MKVMKKMHLGEKMMTIGSNSNEALQETADFKLVVGKSVHEPSKDITVYQVVNKSTDVVELETSVMASAIGAMFNAQHELEAVLKHDWSKSKELSYMDFPDFDEDIPTQ